MEGSLHGDRDQYRSHLGSSLPDPPGRFGDPEAPAVFSRRHNFDFEDVFGGPPKSSLGHESEGGSIDETMWDLSIAMDSLGREKSDFFGECSSPYLTRRKDVEDDFFSDIFRGSESSACSTPRTGLDRDSISSNMMINTVDSSLPRIESCVESSSLSSKLSLLKKMTEQRDDDLYSPIKNEDSYLDAKYVAEVQSKLKSNKPNILFLPISSHNSCHKYSSGSKVKVGHFHFSMHKWASKGVMLDASSTSKESCRYIGRLRGLPVPFLHGPDIPCSNKITPTSHHIESRIQDNILSSEPYTQEIFSMDSSIMADIIPGPEKNNNKLDEDRDDFLSYSSPRGSTEGPVDFKKNNINRSIGDQTIAQDIPVELEENIQIGKIRGKVKNIINNFNEDLSRSQSDKPKYIRKVKVKEDVKTQKTKEYPENIYNSDVESAAHIDSPAQQVFKEERVQSDMNFNVRKEFESFDEGRRSQMQSFESEVPYNITEVIHYEVEEFMVEELEGHNEPLQVQSDFKKIQKSDTKIQTWSSGKQGNIRSLLSTLQYVLWEGSGWKPVALVDIIETSSVKRNYQKALLQLHPDKLQQRGASAEQKYTAEKVFSILQESWNHFNTLSAL